MAGDPDDLRRLETAVAKLPRRQRDIFLAHRLDGLSYGEIAARTGLSSRQVERNIARALSRIDRELCGDRLHWWNRWF